MKELLERFSLIAAASALPLLILLGMASGGSSREGVIINGVLQVVSALMLAACVLNSRLPPLTASARWLLFIGGAFLLLAGLSLAPLPQSVWTALPGRDQILQGFGLLQEANPGAMPASLTPNETLQGLLRFIPPTAVFVLTAKAAWRTPSNVFRWGVIALAVTSVLLGFAQVFAGRDSPLFFWEITNRGSPVGVMANANHQATLLLMSLPFCAVILSRLHLNWQMGDGDSSQALLAGFAALVLAIGVIMAGSAAGIAMLGPVVVASFLMFRGRRIALSDILWALGAVAALTALGLWIATSPILPAIGITTLDDAALGRPNIWRRTLTAAFEHFPAGSGLGSFEQLFQRYEDRADITGTFVNHAHNDYLEVLLETGAPGALLGLLFLISVLRLTFASWSAEPGEGARMKKAASIGLWVVIVHSVVDYPLRTETIALLAAFYLGLLVASPAPRKRRRLAFDADEQVTGTGHVVI